MAQSSRLQALSNLADKVPSQQARAAKQRMAGQQYGMKQQIAGARGGTVNMQTAITAGAQSKALAGQGAAEARGQALQQTGQISQMQTRQIAQEGQQQLADKEDLMQRAQIHLANKLNQIDQNAKTRVWNERVSFSADEARRGYLKQRQMADYAVLSANSKQDYLNQAQKVEQWNRKQIQIMEQLHEDMMQRLQNAESLREQGLDENSQRRAREMVAEYKRLIEKKKAAAANNRAMWTAGGTIVGAIIGAFASNPAAGAAIGGAVGTAAGGATS